MKNLHHQRRLCLTTLILVTFHILFIKTSALALPSKRQTSIVTGANGYLGREIVHALQNDSQTPTPAQIYCLVRAQRVKEEQDYWDTISEKPCDIIVLPYDMLDGGVTITQAFKKAKMDDDLEEEESDCCVYHVASVFSLTEDHEGMAHENVKGAKDLMTAASHFKNVRVVLTSSMAAVRAGGQVPANKKWYTYEDWNTGSELGKNWGNSYQWSKAESEKEARALAKQYGIPFTSICPPFIFGPPSDASTSSKSYSLSIVKSWIKGEAAVQSRLCADVRDVALAHVRIGGLNVMGERIICSTEERIPSQNMAESLREIAEENELDTADKIYPDVEFDGGMIPIGEREVECKERLGKLLGGLVCRPVEETMSDMAKTLLIAEQTTK